MVEEIPWIPYLALEYLNTIINSKMSIFEYGSGGSTIYFSQRAKSVVSIEHDLEWYQEIELQIKSNVSYKIIPYETPPIGKDKSNPAHYMSGPFMASFKNYVSSIDSYDNFDIIFIDGRSRASCLAHSVNKVKTGGWLILDNAERDYYLKQTAHLFESWESVTFFGYGPYINWPWKTIFMRCPND